MKKDSSKMGLMLTLLLTSLLAGAVCAAETSIQPVVASIQTTAGLTASGRLVGLADRIRLDASTVVPRLAPDQLVLLPTETVNQITFDFPRMVIETDEGVYVSPFSISSGIAEELVLERDTDRLTLPVTSLRSIALHGTPVHQPPRVWVGDGFYSVPPLIPATPKMSVTSVESAVDVAKESIGWEEETAAPVVKAIEVASEPVPSEDEEDEILLASPWDQPPAPSSSLPSREVPDWLGLLIVLGIIFVTYLLI